MTLRPTHVTKEAWSDILDDLQDLGGWHAADLTPNSSEAGHRRTLLRRTAALFPYSAELNLVKRVREVAPVEGSDEQVLEVLVGNSNEFPYFYYQHAANLLAMGYSFKDAAALLPFSRNTVSELARWLGLDRSSQFDALTGEAFELMDTPSMELTSKELAERMGVPKRQAAKAIARARKWHQGEWDA